MLCENPFRRTGLSTLFSEFVRHGLRTHPQVNWLLFCGAAQPIDVMDARVRRVDHFPSNEHRRQRLAADHFQVGPAARRLGADALLTVGFVPLRAPVPVIMQVFSLHHLGGGGGWRGWYRRRALSNGLNRARLVIANSEWTTERLRHFCPAVSPRLLTSPEGLQRERFSPAEGLASLPEARAALGLPPRYLLWSSNFYRYKRAEAALAVYAALPGETRQSLPLVLIGGDWEGGLERVRAEARRLGVEGQTRFLGWIDDRWLPACYAGAHALVLSTAEETFGRSVLEAMACGCPGVLQDLPVLREVAGDAARYVDFLDTPAAAGMLEQVCADAHLRDRLARAGLERAERFSFERLARERLDAILAAVAPSPPVTG